MNKTALTKTYTKDIQNSCLNSKKIVLSLATISFLASCTHATLTPEIKTYEETNRHAKARSGLQSRNSKNETINNLQTSTKTISGTGNTLVIESSGTITISNGGQQAVNFQPNSSTSTFLNKGTLIGGNNTASVQLGANGNNGVNIETFDNQGIIGNGSSKFGVTVWGGGKDNMEFEARAEAMKLKAEEAKEKEEENKEKDDKNSENSLEKTDKDSKNNDKNSNFDKDFKNLVTRTYQQNSQNNDIKFSIAS